MKTAAIKLKHCGLASICYRRCFNTYQNIEVSKTILCVELDVTIGINHPYLQKQFKDIPALATNRKKPQVLLLLMNFSCTRKATLSRRYLYIWRRLALTAYSNRRKIYTYFMKPNQPNAMPQLRSLNAKHMKNYYPDLFWKDGIFLVFLSFLTWCWLAMDNLSCWFRCKRGSGIDSIFCWRWPRFTVSFRWCISMVNL